MRYRTDANGVQESWHEFLTTRSSGARKALIEAYYPLVRRVAGAMWKKMRGAEYEELAQIGVTGLIRAVEMWDPESNPDAKFETYAIPAIRGSILDALRSSDWAPRSLRRRFREVEKARVKAETALGREPTHGEIAQVLGEPTEEVAKRYAEADRAMVRELEFEVSSERDEGTETRGDHIVSETDNPESNAVVARVVAIARDVMTDLPLEQRVILAMHYYEGRTLGEVAKVMSLTESRASQLHTRAVLAVREAVAEALTG